MKYLYLKQTQDMEQIFIDVRILYNTMLQFLCRSKIFILKVPTL